MRTRSWSFSRPTSYGGIRKYQVGDYSPWSSAAWSALKDGSTVAVSIGGAPEDPPVHH